MLYRRNGSFNQDRLDIEEGIEFLYNYFQLLLVLVVLKITIMIVIVVFFH